MKMEKKLKDVPVVGKEYYFFDDGKTSPGRCYKAKVLNVVSADKETLVDFYDYDMGAVINKDLRDIHKDAVDEHRQSGNFIVLNGSDTKPGEPWLYAEKTDYFIRCEIPKYDDNEIWFARTVDGGWFSMDVSDGWQSGRLDVDNEIFNNAKKYFDEMCEDGYYETMIGDQLIK